MKYCKDCAWFEQCETFAYCLVQPLYTEVRAGDEACEEFESNNED